MANLSQPATLANLQQVVGNMKVYVDSDKTKSIKGYLKKNNTHCFYSTDAPTEDTTPVFSFDVAEEMFLDQAKTKFVPNFVWSAETYANSTNPNLDGKPVMVLAVKGEESVTYSFLNLVELVDTYTTKDTSSLSLSISEAGEISGNVNISKEEGNAIEEKEDGLYAAGGGATSFVITCDLSTDTEEMTISNVSESFTDIYKACVEGKIVKLKVYVNEERTVYQNMTPSLVSPQQIAFSMYQATDENASTSFSVIISSEDYYSVIFNEMSLEDIGGTEPFLVTFYFSSTLMSLVQNANKTYDEISTALDEGKAVILKGIDTSQNSQQFYYFNVSKYDKSTSQIIFTRVYHTYGAKPEIWYYLLGAGHMIGKFTIDLSNYVTEEKLAEEIAGASHLTREIVTEIPTVDTAKDNVIYMYKVESATGSDVYQEYQLINGAVVLVGDTSVDLTDYQKLLSGTKGQFVGFDDNGKAIAQSADTSLSSASNNPIANKTVFYELSKKQENLAGKGLAGQFVGFTNEGEIDITEDLPAYARAGGTTAENDSRITITATSLVIKQHFRRAKITLTNTLPNTGSGNLGGRVVVELYRVADGTYKCFSTCSPVINTNSANVVTVYNFAASVSVSEQSNGTLKITSSAGGGMYGLNIETGTTNPSGSGGAGGNFNDILVWF